MQNLFFDEMDWSGKKLILICVPYGGGWSTIFNNWEQYLEPEIALLAAKFPGRGERMEEPSYENMQKLIQEISPVIAVYELPIVFYGGCFGGLCAYEIIKELQETYHRKVMHFFTNSLISPRYIKEEVFLSQWSKEELAHELLRRGELPKEVLGDEEVLEFLLPGIRADYRIYENYQYRETGKIDVNMTIFYNNTTKIRQEADKDWEHLIQGAYERIPIECDNLFAVEPQIEIAKQINSRLKQLYLS